MEFISEIRRGYSSIFKYNCKMCGTKLNISSEIDQKSESINSNKNYLPINQALVNGSIAIGKNRIFRILYYFNLVFSILILIKL